MNNAAFVNRDQIQVRGPDGSNILWSRRQAAAPNTAHAAPAPNAPAINLTGLWRSSSGSSVQLSGEGQQVIVTIINANGGRHQGSGRWLKAGVSFDYSLPGFPGVALCTVINRNQISVLYDNVKTTWTRQ